MDEDLEAAGLNSERDQPSNKKWTFFLLVCCVAASLNGTFNFGFNIASLNSPTDILKGFIKSELWLFKEYYEKKALFEMSEGWLNGNKSLLKERKLMMHDKETIVASCMDFFNFNKAPDCDETVENITSESKKRIAEANARYNQSFENMNEALAFVENLLESKSKQLEEARGKLAAGTQKVDSVTNLFWTLINGLFVVGGMIGAFTSKFVLDYLGRKKGILFNCGFVVLAAVLVFAAPYARSPVLIMVSRFFYGIQGGMTCSLTPTYLSEISPSELRGSTGVIPQLFITLGILMGQILGFKEIFGNENLWNFLLAFPVLTTVLAAAVFFFCPDSPKELLMNEKVEEARAALGKLRNQENVQSEVKAIQLELASSTSNDSMSLIQLLKSSELRWPLITALVIQITQQLSGVNAIFFYSSSIFKTANIPDAYIQYAILSTGVINVLTTIACVPLIDKLGRKPLLVYPMAGMLVVFTLITIFLNLDGQIFAYLSIVCIIIFIVLFAVGLGPIPFIYVAECFRQNSRSAAMAICILTNWSASLLLTLAFPFVQSALKEYVFCVFLVIVLCSLVFTIFKVPETKGKSADQIIKSFSKNK